MSVLGIGVDMVQVERIQHSLDRFGDGTGVGKVMGWRDIDVHKKKSGEPFLVLHGGAKALAKERAMKSAWISLSHTEHHAVAMIVIEA